MVGANIHDSRLVGFTIESNSDIVTRFELCCGGFHLCLDKGYDYKRVNDECAHMDLKLISDHVVKKNLTKKRSDILLAAGL